MGKLTGHIRVYRGIPDNAATLDSFEGVRDAAVTKLTKKAAPGRSYWGSARAMDTLPDGAQALASSTDSNIISDNSDTARPE